MQIYENVLDEHRGSVSNFTVSLTIFNRSGDNREVKVQAFLDFFIAHNSEIIQWLLAAILLIFCGYIAWFLFRKPGKDEISESSTESTEEIKKALHEVLEATKKVSVGAGASSEVSPKTPAAGEPPAASAPAGAAVAAVNPETEAENKKLQQKVEALQKELESTKAASEGSDESKAKIEELEAKLAEYEILEDDIADLSLFKEENEKLKKKLAELGSSLEEDPPAAAPDTESEEGESLVEEFQAAVDLTAEASSEPEEELMAPLMEEAEETPSPDTSVEEDFVAEFQAAVNVKKESGSEEDKSEAPTEAGEAKTAEVTPQPSQEEPTQEEAPKQPQAAASSESNSEIDAVSADDLMAEFAQSIGENSDDDSGDDSSQVAEENAGAAASVAQLDTDKMLEEMANLTLNPTDDDGSSALEEGIDTEKMAAEASKLGSEG